MVLTETLKFGIDSYICYELFSYYNEKNNFERFESFCEYTGGYIVKDYIFNELPLNIKMVLITVCSKVCYVFGLHISIIIELFITFFKDKLYNEYYKLAMIISNVFDK